MKRIAINGLGRVGRLVLRQMLERPLHDNKGNKDTIEIVAANDLVSCDDLAYLINYDSVHGRLKVPVKVEGDTLQHTLQQEEKRIKIFAEKDPANLPWKALNVDVVLECTGLFIKRELSAKHLQAGARRVLISAPAKDADVTIVLGVNEEDFDPVKHQVVSNASCTTNSLAPALKVLLDNFGIEQVLVTSVHAYTASQAIVDKAARKKHQGRAAAVNLIPTSTGADVATVSVLPALKDRIRAIAIRVPVPDGALTDISAVLKKPVTAEEVNAAFKRAAEGSMQGILGYSEEELVSSDIIDDPRSGIVHALSTLVVQDRMVKVQVWYDNEFAYACRLLDVVERLPL